MMENSLSTISFAPIIPELWLWALAGLFGLLAAYGLVRLKRGTLWRILCALAFLTLLASPSWLEEERQPFKDIAALIIDQTPSQSFENRNEQTARAAEHIKDTLANNPAIELRTRTIDGSENTSGRTELFGALEETMNDVPPDRRAGVIMITDGQVHDVPSPDQLEEYGPVHTLLTGDKDAFDRRIKIVKAPAYGITGQSVSVTFKLETTGATASNNVPVQIRNQDGEEETLMVEEQKEYTIEAPIRNAGQNIVELSTPPLDGELTDINNRAVALINGVRDRLKVLLVSGKPHIGERTWRNLLTSDPGVDLVHFTILREIHKRDATPQDELSLIPFPFRELFEVKLYDFDLIVFDNYRLNNILPPRYFENIVRYVEEGGALLESSGASYMDERRSIYNSPLQAILPYEPQGQSRLGSYRPSLSEKGQYHPVTRPLRDKAEEWGPWLLHNRVRNKSGEVLLYGPNTAPLLTLERTDKGRIAQLASDHIWLWAKGYEGGGPHAELLRRIVHWLMKEPELDEKALNVTVQDRKISLRKQDYGDTGRELTLTKPNGEQTQITLEADENTGWLTAGLTADQSGIYQFETGEGKTKFAIVGTPNPPEMREVISTAEKLKSIVKHTRGTSIWLQDELQPRIAALEKRAHSQYGGSGWLALRKNNSYTVTDLKQHPILTPWLSLLAVLGLLLLTWWREGRQN